MMDNKDNYKDIAKATTLFGGVQVIRIIVGIIQSKVVAILLGASGVGVFGLFTTAMQIINKVFGLGLATSAVREISVAMNSDSSLKLSKIIITLRRLVILMGLLGAIFTFLFSLKLSIWTFGNEDYKWGFRILSFFVLITSINTAEFAILQGSHRLRYLAKSSVLSSIFGLLISIPIYYYYGVKGIVPGIIVTSVCILLCSCYYTRKIYLDRIKITIKESVKLSGVMVRLGFFLMLSGFVAALFSHLTNVFINHYGSITDVGLYRAGFLVVNQYVGLVFSAMTADYLPRLSSQSHDVKSMVRTANQQGEIAILIIAPLVVSLVTFAPIIVRILYSSEFSPIVGFISLASVAMLFKAGSWCLSHLLLAKGKGKMFFYTETLIGIINLITNIVGYKLWGLTGLGISYIITYVFYYLLHYLISKRLFDFKLSKNFVKLFVVLNSFCFLIFILYLFVDSNIMYLIGGVLTVITFIYSFKKISLLIDLSSFIGILKKRN